MENGIYAKFNTTKGAIVVKLTYDLTPGTVGNFVGLAEGQLENSGKPMGKPYLCMITVALHSTLLTPCLAPPRSTKIAMPGREESLLQRQCMTMLTG